MGVSGIIGRPFREQSADGILVGPAADWQDDACRDVVAEFMCLQGRLNEKMPIRRLFQADEAGINSRLIDILPFRRLFAGVF